MNLMSDVCKWLEEQDRIKLDTRVRTSHHPSGANKCMRQLYYDWIGFPVSNYRDATAILRMDMGTWMHKMWADYLVRMGLNVKSEVEVFVEDPNLKYPIHGYIDNAIQVDDELYVTELKTVFGRGATSIKDSGRPREDDEIQVKVYEAFNSVKGVVLDYLARDSFYRCEFTWSMSSKQRDEFKKWIIRKFKLLEALVELKKLPDRGFHAVVADCEIKDKKQVNKVIYKSDWQCLYCVYRDGCYASEIADGGLHLPERGGDDE